MLRVVTLARRPYGTAPGREIGAPADLIVERKAKDAFGTIPHHTTVPGTRGDFLSLPLSLLLSSTYYLSSPNSRRSPSARSSSFFSPNSLFSPVVPFSPSEVAPWKCHRHRRARFPSFLDDDVYFHEIVPPYTNFGRDVVARRGR